MLKFDNKGNFTFEYMVSIASKDCRYLLDMAGKKELEIFVNGLSDMCEYLADNDCLYANEKIALETEKKYKFYSNLYESVQALCNGKCFTEEKGWIF